MRTLTCLALPGFLLTAALAAPPAAPKLVRPTALSVNTKDDEDEPHIIGDSLYFTSNAEGKFSILLATRKSPLAAWGKPKAPDGVGTEVDDRGVFFVAERTGFQYLFFATQRDKESKNFDIYVVQRNDSKKAWSALTPVNTIATDDDEMHPWLTEDRKHMYFSRKVKAAGKDRWRVFVATRPTGLGPQFPGEVKDVVREIKELPDDFHHATLTPDGQTMFLQGPLGKERWGLFRSDKVDGKWDEPKNLTMLNDPTGPTGDRSPCLSRDGLMLYFASDRDGGKGGLDLYSVSVSSLK